uniref:Putative secreted protein n=1 Tax=Ixodes ricinus TaxID=34613 RepID=A0A6B0U5C9_IXORI
MRITLVSEITEVLSFVLLVTTAVIDLVLGGTAQQVVHEIAAGCVFSQLALGDEDSACIFVNVEIPVDTAFPRIQVRHE